MKRTITVMLLGVCLAASLLVPAFAQPPDEPEEQADCDAVYAEQYIDWLDFLRGGSAQPRRPDPDSSCFSAALQAQTDAVTLTQDRPAPASPPPASAPARPPTLPSAAPRGADCAPALGGPEYVARPESYSAQLIESVARIERLTRQRPPQSPAQATSWLNELRGAVGVWRTLYQDAQGVCPPDSFADQHQLVRRELELLDGAAADITEAVGLMEQGMNRRDMALMLRAEPLLNRALEKMQQAVAIEEQWQRGLQELRRDLVQPR